MFSYFTDFRVLAVLQFPFSGQQSHCKAMRSMGTAHGVASFSGYSGGGYGGGGFSGGQGDFDSAAQYAHDDFTEKTGDKIWMIKAKQISKIIKITKNYIA